MPIPFSSRSSGQVWSSSQFFSIYSVSMFTDLFPRLRAHPAPGRPARQTGRPTNVTRPSKPPGRPGRRPTPPKPSQTRPVKPTDSRSDTGPQNIRKSIVRAQEPNAWGRGQQCLGPREQWLGSMQETNGWSPTNKWLVLRKPRVGAREINGCGSGNKWLESRK